ncbi:hypothetical protein [Rhodococcus rhodochrous]|uniref:hypothetical protein n=1 Tax=Rhodococcus rhodochrous TaxID=1829 RepID=UPI001783A20A|nr:hypothetical protein [Rhodococcus rhodochrous]QOH59887.1 hypothetical protein C6Y44_27745 [Rhodococcus rhodochrous]
MASELTFPRPLKHVSTGRIVTAQSARDYHNLRGSGYAELPAPAAKATPVRAETKPADDAKSGK